MPHYYCPCGSRLERFSSARSLKSSCLRLFVSIKTIQVVSSETKVCDSCRSAYYGWKKKNPEFGDLLSPIEEEELVEIENNFDTNEVIKILFFI